MKQGKSASPTLHGIIANGDAQYGTWPTNRRLPQGWRYTGVTGTQAELLVILRTQYVETLPAPLITSQAPSRPAPLAD